MRGTDGAAAVCAFVEMACNAWVGTERALGGTGIPLAALFVGSNLLATAFPVVLGTPVDPAGAAVDLALVIVSVAFLNGVSLTLLAVRASVTGVVVVLWFVLASMFSVVRASITGMMGVLWFIVDCVISRVLTGSITNVVMLWLLGRILVAGGNVVSSVVGTCGEASHGCGGQGGDGKDVCEMHGEDSVSRVRY